MWYYFKKKNFENWRSIKASWYGMIACDPHSLVVWSLPNHLLYIINGNDQNVTATNKKTTPFPCNVLAKNCVTESQRSHRVEGLGLNKVKPKTANWLEKIKAFSYFVQNTTCYEQFRNNPMSLWPSLLILLMIFHIILGILYKMVLCCLVLMMISQDFINYL